MSRVSNKPYYLYVIWSDASRRFYIGISEDPAHRLEQHNHGASKWTAKFGPWKLVQVEEYADYTGARKRELALKKQKGGNGLYKLLGRSFNELIQTGEKPGS